jgi:hypothetical protein
MARGAAQALNMERGNIAQTDEQRERFIEREVQRRVSDALADAPDLMERAVERGLRKVIDDPAVQARFWARGYAELEKHAGANLAQAIGRRVILFVVTAAVGMALAWSWIVGRPDR